MHQLNDHHFSWRTLALIPLLLVLASWPWTAQTADSLSPTTVSIEVQGRLICIPEFMHEKYDADLPTNHEHLLGFHTTDDRVYTLLRTKLSEALFADSQLREKELLLKGKVYPGSQVLDVTIMRSIRHGQVHDLFYWCDICAIKSVIPGTCMCCQEDVVLKEIPPDKNTP